MARIKDLTGKKFGTKVDWAMKCIVLTSKSYQNFVWDNIDHKPLYHKIDMYVGKMKEFPQDYDIGISFMYPYKVPAEEVKSHTWINFHPGPLPEYKGRNLCYHAIMNGESEFGATVHYMDENFDTGDIIDVSYFPVLDWHTAKDLSDKTIERSMQQFREYLPRILEGEKFDRMPNVGGTYYQKLSIDDVVHISTNSKQWIRAKYYPPHYPKIDINGITYRIVKDE